MSRSPRHPYVWVRVIRACTALSATEKLIWDELRALSLRPAGATVGAGVLGLRLGVSRDTIERGRRRLQLLGLLYKADRGAGVPAAWFVQLPAHCCPGHHRLCDDDVQHLAELLSARICAHSGGAYAATPPSDVAQLVRNRAATVAASAPPVLSRNPRPDRLFHAPLLATHGEHGERGLNFHYGFPGEKGDPEVQERRAAVFE